MDKETNSLKYLHFVKSDVILNTSTSITLKYKLDLYVQMLEASPAFPCI